MGVTGLWRLIDPAGKPVPVETLENKVLAVDISIWLHQVVKGYQDAKGAPLPNAHLVGLFQRLCKLLYFRIKPVFVFDGGFPELKKETIAKRQDNKSKYNSASERIKREIALLLGKKTAIGALLGKQISPKKNKNIVQDNNDDIFKLPALPQKDEETESESEDEQDSSASTVDLHTVDIESDDFKNMPVKEKYNLLVDLKETRKMNSWGKLHTLPKKSENFSDFQMQRLLKRRKVQECLAETEKEMGDSGMSLNDLEKLLNEEGIDTKIENFPTRRIASDNTTRFLLISNVKQAIADAKKREEEAENSKVNQEVGSHNKDELEDDLQKAIKMSLEIDDESSKTDDHSKDDTKKKDELENDLQKAIKMSLECVEEPYTSACTSKTDDSWTSVMTDSDYSDICTDSEEEDGYSQPDFSSAKAYIMQYSDFTHKAIDNIVATKNKTNKKRTKGRHVEEILEEINQDKSVIIDKLDVSSGDEVSVRDIPSEELNLSLKQEADLHNEPFSNDKMLIAEKQTDSSKIKESNIDFDITQSSVVCIENPCDDVITLDATIEEDTTIKVDSAPLKSNKLSVDNQSDSSEGEFEEVLEVESTVAKHVVELTLDPIDVLEDDIFADVFVKRSPDQSRKDGENVEILNSVKLTVDEIVKKQDNDEKENRVESKTIQKDILGVKEMHKPILIEKVTKDLPQITSTSSIANEGLSITESNTIETNKTGPVAKNVISTEMLTSMVTEIENEEQNLLQEKGRMERIGRNITEQMTKEAQELLQIFGIPYIVAPMEAEAQCAFLESVKLTDGTITDDSDIWLFGGKTVYKNFFNQKKHVLQFLSERIEKSFNLSREQLILLALLVGSDYTTGVTGVGPVTALEILASFPFDKKQFLNETSKHGQYQQVITGLQEFKKWVKAGKRTDNISLKKKLKNVSLSEDFPSVRVVQAYLEPNIEKSEDKFTWGELDITILRDYTKAKFGWSQNKLDVIIQPVLKRLIERKTQRTVHDYFKRKIDFQSLEDQMSKRVKAAVQKMDSGRSNTEAEQVIGDELKLPKKRKPRKEKISNKEVDCNTAGPSKGKKKKIVESVVKICSTTESGIDIKIPKTDRYQEIIPQREKDKQNILQNKLKAIEVFRKKNIDQKKKPVKRRVNLPKDEANLSESSDSN